MNQFTRRVLFFLFFLSGFSSLVYQVVWTRMAFASFGIITPVLSVVLSVFMLGLARRLLGGRALDSGADAENRAFRRIFLWRRGTGHRAGGVCGSEIVCRRRTSFAGQRRDGFLHGYLLLSALVLAAFHPALVRVHGDNVSLHDGLHPGTG
jgi:hypothetical protein